MRRCDVFIKLCWRIFVRSCMHLYICVHAQTHKQLLLQSCKKLFSCIQRQLTVFCKIFLVVCDDDITTSSNGTLILQHILKIFAWMVNGIPQLMPVHRKCIDTVREYVGVDKNFGYLFRMYARRSSLSISSWVKCPMPLICLNSLGSSGRSFQSVFSFVALALEARRCEVVIRRRALIAFL